MYVHKYITLLDAIEIVSNIQKYFGAPCNTSKKTVQKNFNQIQKNKNDFSVLTKISNI